MARVNSHVAHKFAFYVSGLDELMRHKVSGDYIHIKDPDLVHRIINVLRLKKNEACTFFNQTLSVEVNVGDVLKKVLLCALVQVRVVVELIPSITFVLPVLKRENLDEALSHLAEVGINKIRLVYTDHTQRVLLEKDIDRCRRVLIAAAEQSKYFAFPTLYAPESLEKVITAYGQERPCLRLVCDPTGASFFDQILKIKEHISQDIWIAVGPEADFSAQEKRFLSDKGFIKVALTQTILRASQAASLSAGILRSLI